MGQQDIKDYSVYKLLSHEDKIKQGLSEDPVVALVDSILYKAIKFSASDIHLEQQQKDMRVRYRLDGILYDQDPINFNKRLSVLSRLKVLSSLDIAEKRIPQDGKFRVETEDEDKTSKFIDIRVSTFPSVHGEKMVLRILDNSANFIKLDSLGFSFDVLQSIRKIIERPSGFFLVTGPTGSGKTTTLYAILSELNNSKRNIITMEDPVEYNLDGITQSQVNVKSGFTFETGLRSMLRQDPDVIMVGEIRDKQTAQIAIEAALTGHLVLSTLHTNDSSGAITRLLDMGVEPFLINASLCAVLAQRLCRRLCSDCREETIFSEQEKEFLKNDLKNKDRVSFSSSGCKRCFNLGHKGRIGIFELLSVDDNIRNLIMTRPSCNLIKDQAIKSGMQFLFQDGLEKLEDGSISLEELIRVIGKE